MSIRPDVGRKAPSAVHAGGAEAWPCAAPTTRRSSRCARKCRAPASPAARQPRCQARQCARLRRRANTMTAFRRPNGFSPLTTPAACNPAAQTGSEARFRSTHRKATRKPSFGMPLARARFCPDIRESRRANPCLLCAMHASKQPVAALVIPVQWHRFGFAKGPQAKVVPQHGEANTRPADLIILQQPRPDLQETR